jgi:DNA (cytosine-5)-methyltransferase 1
LKVLKKELDMKNIRIRKLTPTECYKLMGFTAEDCQKCSEGGISNTQLYKQAGNSIVVNVLEAIFTSLGKTYEEFRSIP